MHIYFYITSYTSICTYIHMYIRSPQSEPRELLLCVGRQSESPMPRLGVRARACVCVHVYIYIYIHTHNGMHIVC